MITKIIDRFLPQSEEKYGQHFKCLLIFALAFCLFSLLLKTLTGMYGLRGRVDHFKVVGLKNVAKANKH